MQALGFQINTPTVPVIQYTLNKRQLDEQALKRFLSAAQNSTSRSSTAPYITIYPNLQRYRGSVEITPQTNSDIDSSTDEFNPFAPRPQKLTRFQRFTHALHSSRTVSCILPSILSAVGILLFCLLLSVPSQHQSLSISEFPTCSLYGSTLQCGTTKALFTILLGFVTVICLSLAICAWIAKEPFYSVLSWYYPYLGIGNAYKGIILSPEPTQPSSQVADSRTPSPASPPQQPPHSPQPATQYKWSKPSWNDPKYIFSLTCNLLFFVMSFAGITVQLLFLLLFLVSSLNCDQGCVNDGTIIASSIVSLILYVYTTSQLLILGIIAITFDRTTPLTLSIIPALIYSKKHAQVQLTNNNINIFSPNPAPFPLSALAEQHIRDERRDEASITITEPDSASDSRKSTDHSPNLTHLISTLSLESQQRFFHLQDCHDQIHNIAEQCHIEIPAGMFFVHDAKYPDIPVIPIAMIIENKSDSSPDLAVGTSGAENGNAVANNTNAGPTSNTQNNTEDQTSTNTTTANSLNTAQEARNTTQRTQNDQNQALAQPNPEQLSQTPPNTAQSPSTLPQPFNHPELGSPTRDLPRAFGNALISPTTLANARSVQNSTQIHPTEQNLSRHDQLHQNGDNRDNSQQTRPFSPFSPFSSLPQIPNNSHISQPPIVSPNGTNLISPVQHQQNHQNQPNSRHNGHNDPLPPISNELSNPAQLESQSTAQQTALAVTNQNNQLTQPTAQPKPVQAKSTQPTSQSATTQPNSQNQHRLPTGAPFKLQQRIATYRWLYLHLSTPPLQYVPPAVPLAQQTREQWLTQLPPHPDAPPHIEIQRPESMIWLYRIKRYSPQVSPGAVLAANNGNLPQAPSYSSPSARSFSDGNGASTQLTRHIHPGNSPNRAQTQLHSGNLPQFTQQHTNDSHHNDLNTQNNNNNNNPSEINNPPSKSLTSTSSTQQFSTPVSHSPFNSMSTGTTQQPHHHLHQQPHQFTPRTPNRHMHHNTSTTNPPAPHSPLNNRHGSITPAHHHHHHHHHQQHQNSPLPQLPLPSVLPSSIPPRHGLSTQFTDSTPYSNLSIHSNHSNRSNQSISTENDFETQQRSNCSQYPANIHPHANTAHSNDHNSINHNPHNPNNSFSRPTDHHDASIQPPNSTTSRSRRNHKLNPITPSSNKVMSHSPNSLCADDEEEVCLICQLALWPDQYENLREHWVEVPNRPQKVLKLKKMPVFDGTDLLSGAFSQGDQGDQDVHGVNSKPIQTIDEGELLGVQNQNNNNNKNQPHILHSTTATRNINSVQAPGHPSGQVPSQPAQHQLTTTTTTLDDFNPGLLSPPNTLQHQSPFPLDAHPHHSSLSPIATSEQPHTPNHTAAQHLHTHRPTNNILNSNTHNSTQNTNNLSSLHNVALSSSLPFSRPVISNAPDLHLKPQYEEVMEIPEVGFGEVVSLCPANGHAKMHSVCCEQWLWHCALAQTHVKCGVCRLSIPLSIDVVSSVAKALPKVQDIRQLIQHNGVNNHVNFKK